MERVCIVCGLCAEPAVALWGAHTRPRHRSQRRLSDTRDTPRFTPHGDGLLTRDSRHHTHEMQILFLLLLARPFFYTQCGYTVYRTPFFCTDRLFGGIRGVCAPHWCTTVEA